MLSDSFKLTVLFAPALWWWWWRFFSLIFNTSFFYLKWRLKRTKCFFMVRLWLDARDVILMCETKIREILLLCALIRVQLSVRWSVLFYMSITHKSWYWWSTLQSAKWEIFSLIVYIVIISRSVHFAFVINIFPLRAWAWHSFLYKRRTWTLID